MKKKGKIIIITLVIASIAFLSSKIFIQIEMQKKISENIKKLPPFSFVQLDGSTCTNDNIKSNNGVVLIIYFDPDCDHCQYVTTQIVKNINAFSNSQIIMVTNADIISVKHFVTAYHLQGIKNMIVLRDPRSDFYRIFGSAVTPSFFIYKNGIISKTIKGETKIENIINAIK
jgi:peroxiredoxin